MTARDGNEGSSGTPTIPKSDHPSLAWTCLPLIAFGITFGLLLLVSLAAPGRVEFAKSVPVSALAALMVTVALSPDRRKATVRAFLQGMRQDMVLRMGGIFLLAGVFAALGQAVGSIDAIVAISLRLLPEDWILPGLFGASCAASLAMGTSMGTIAAVVPIAVGVAASGGGSSAVCVATVIGGAMFGDNLSVISDTTIAATKTQGCRMRDKLWVNAPIALSAAGVTVVFLLVLGSSAQTLPQPSPAGVSWSAAWPYGAALALALCGVPVLWVLGVGIALCLGVGVAAGFLSAVRLPGLLVAGCMSMFDVLSASFFVAGLVHVTQERGGLWAILRRLQRHVRSKSGAEASVAALAAVADICTANNTIAILLCGPLARRIGERFQLNRARCAGLLDIYACVPQGLLPYGAQMLLAAGLSGVSAFHIIPYVIYPVLLGLAAAVDMACRLVRDYE